MTDRLEAALEEIRAVLRAGEELERRDVRDVLVPLGELLLEGRTADAEGALARLREALAGAEAAWGRVVEDELSLACAEHVHSVDPRYLDLPNYDLEYTRRARRRLEARLRAARELGLGPSEALLSQVARADALLVERFGPAPAEPGAGSGEPSPDI